jgi:hypothetical protein
VALDKTVFLDQGEASSQSEVLGWLIDLSDGTDVAIDSTTFKIDGPEKTFVKYDKAKNLFIIIQNNTQKPLVSYDYVKNGSKTYLFRAYCEGDRRWD